MSQTSAEEALQSIQSNMRIFVHGSAATPTRLLDALSSHASRLKDVELIHLHTEGNLKYLEPKSAASFKVANLFVGANTRKLLDYDRVDYLPHFLSEIPQLFRSGRRPIDVALIQVSPPDQHGFCTLGTAVDVARAAVDNAKLVIAQINSQMPRVHGDGFVHVNRFHSFIEVNEPLPEVKSSEPSEVERTIGEFVSSQIEDGSTIQVGIGGIPNAVLASLKGHRHLGVHSEMWSDGMLDLIQLGVVDNSRKVVYQGRSVSTFLMGSRRLYDFVNDNPSVVQLDAGYVNAPNVIARNPKVAAINSAIEIDLTGQVCADSLGSQIYSGVGGQMDFIRGASLSRGGKPIIALTSRTKHGLPRIVSQLKPGAGVVTTRAHVHLVVTEYGVADLYGKTLGERARALIQISNPLDREKLEREWWELTHPKRAGV